MFEVDLHPGATAQVIPGLAEVAKRPGTTEAERTKNSALLAAALLTPFAGALEDPTKRKIRVFAPDPVRSVDVHALPWLRDRPLGERFSVTYGLDVLRPKEAPITGARRALVVAPASNLNQTLHEAELVEHALIAAGWKVRVMKGPTATRAAVREALAEPGLQLLHYVGHGMARGRDGWESHLRLDGGQWLSIADVLSLPRAPRLVLLASCETATAKSDALVLGPTLADAFLVAGSRVVIASPVTVRDDATSALVKELYEHHLTELVSDPAAALRDALRPLHTDPASDARLPRLRVYMR